MPATGPLSSLSRVPPVAVFVVVLATFLLGVVLRGLAGTLVLTALAVAVASLLVATWPRLTNPERTVRVLVLLVLIAITVQLAVASIGTG